MRRWFAMVVLGACMCACKTQKIKDDAAVVTAKDPPMSTATPEVAALRDEVLARTLIWNRNDYAPRNDLAIVDQNIEYALGRSKDRAKVIEEAAHALVQTLTRYPEGIAVLEKTLAARYNAPVITRDGDLVRIDLGVIAGKPTSGRGGLTVSSSFAENGEHGLIASEVIRNLNAGIAAHPDAKTYQVEVDIPGRWAKGGFTYVYDRAEDTIRAYQDDKTDYYYVTETLGGNFSKVSSLHWGSLTQKPMDRLPVRSAELRHK